MSVGQEGRYAAMASVARKLAGVPGRPVDEDGSVQVAEELRPSIE
jgi:hypothetical protein